MDVKRDKKIPRITCRNAYIERGDGCQKGSVPMPVVESAVLESIRYQAALADEMKKKLVQVNKNSNISQLKSRLSKKEQALEKLKQAAMEEYEQFALGRTGKEEYIALKKDNTSKMVLAKQEIESLTEELGKAVQRKEQEKHPFLAVFSKHADIQELSYEIVQELIETIYLYDKEHIEIIWNFRDEYLELCRDLDIAESA